MAIPAILIEACTSEIKKYDLSTPYPWGEHLYGTDGRIMVRCLNSDGVKLEHGRGVPDPTRVTDVGGIERVTVDLPDVPETIPCQWCNGTGITDRYQCDNCGDTQHVMHKGKPVQFDCPDCDGKGVAPNLQDVKVTDEPRWYLAAHYIGFLRRHGVMSVNVPTHSQDGKRMDDPRDCVTFSGDGFEGWLMPLDTKRVEQELARKDKLQPA